MLCSFYMTSFLLCLCNALKNCIVFSFFSFNFISIRRSLCAARCSGARGRRTVESKTEDTEGSWDPCSCSDYYTPQHGDCNDCGTTSLRMPLSGVGPVTSFPPVYYPPRQTSQRCAFKRAGAVPVHDVTERLLPSTPPAPVAWSVPAALL